MRMLSGSTYAIIKAMRPPAQREHAIMLDTANSMGGLDARTTALVAPVILSLCIWCHPFSFLMLEIDFSLVVTLRQRYATWQYMAATGQSWGWTV